MDFGRTEIAALAALLLFVLPSFQGRVMRELGRPVEVRTPNERDHCRRLAPKYGVRGDHVEFRLWDKTRVDLLNEHHAIEVDWAPKWAEAIGQSVYYATVTRRRPAVLLLVRDADKEVKHIYRCQTVCTRLGITLFLEEVEQ